jgi:hypothetical protein
MAIKLLRCKRQVQLERNLRWAGTVVGMRSYNKYLSSQKFEGTSSGHWSKLGQSRSRKAIQIIDEKIA